MRLVALLVTTVMLAFAYVSAAAQAQTEPSAKSQPYEGVWATNAAACRDEDGTERMSIEGTRFYWYETRCQARDVKASGGKSWTMRMSCTGEGQTFRARPRLSLPSPNKLIMDDAPVGPTKHQVYIRCAGK